MKTALVTIVVGKQVQEIWELTGTSFLHYAQKIGAELVVLDSLRMWMPSPHWLKFDLFALLTRCDRIIYMDADILIRPDCPNLFKLVDPEKVGIFNEGKFTPRAMAIHEIKVRLKDDFPGWDGVSYYNSGVMVLSKKHRNVFLKPDSIPQLRFPFGEQTFLNYRLLKSRFPVQELNYKFNRMSLMNSLLGVSRLDSYVVHYAGPESAEVRKTAIKRDLGEWWKGGPKYEYHPCIFIEVGGGLGDQICAEPTLRYLSEVLCPKAEIMALTAYPRLFQHLKNIQVSNRFDRITRDAICNIKTHPAADTGIRRYVSHFFLHAVDYVSLAILRRVLPIGWKQPRFEILPEDRAEVESFRVDVLVHPGKGWEIKTFSIEWWNAIVSGLIGRGLHVGIIGKNINPEHGVLDILAGPGVTDLRDKLSLGGLMAMLEKTPVLISNDSAPVHLAGVFDNQIILIPTCQHPDHLLPVRLSTPGYKCTALYKRLLDQDYPMLPTSIEWTPRGHAFNFADYLPDPEEVVTEVFYRWQQEKYSPIPSSFGLPNVRREINQGGFADVNTF